jgi:macrodomain Ter protein organizer (MatP/YcbG family)
MGNHNNEHLSNDASAKEISDWLSNHLNEHVDLQVKKKISAVERGKVRRNIEDIKERNSLKELLGDDYDLLDS